MSEHFATGRAVDVTPQVCRLLAPNPSMMTGPGTNTYLLGQKRSVVIDPGPPIAAHIDAIVELSGGEVDAILVTHTHPDHSPAAARLAKLTGAPLYGRPAPDGQHQDKTFVPDLVFEDGALFAAADVSLRVLHTPGHASNHLCYLRESDGLLFTGDHIIDGSTVVIDPPDGSMSEYLDSLARLKNEPLKKIAPGHGDLIPEPFSVIDWIINHRLEREHKIIAALRGRDPISSKDLTRIVYAHVDERLYPVAERSLLAHLLKLQVDRRATISNDRWQLQDD
ncbi:MAG: MBL fold metallo-hydrolase [Woeseia sp.]|nr:MBL fold metallo-hydrolase [Woeseia sp.]